MNKGQLFQNQARQSYSSSALQTYSMRSIYIQSFLLIQLLLVFLSYVPDKMNRGHKSPKLGKAEVGFFCTALLLNENTSYVLDKFQSVKMNKGQQLNKFKGRVTVVLHCKITQ
jgi:hypothetical protein